MFCLCALSSFHVRMVCFPSLTSVVMCLFFSVSSSVSCSCTDHPLIHHYLVLSMLFSPLLQQSNCTEVMDSDAHIYLRCILSLSYTNVYIFSIYVFFPLSAQNKYLFTQKPHGGSLPEILYTFTNSVSQEIECKEQHGKLCFEEVL